MLMILIKCKKTRNPRFVEPVLVFRGRGCCFAVSDDEYEMEMLMPAISDENYHRQHSNLCDRDGFTVFRGVQVQRGLNKGPRPQLVFRR